MVHTDRRRNLNGTMGKQYRLACSSCAATTVHKVLLSINEEEHSNSPGYSMTVWEAFEIVECQGCTEVSFRHASQNSENTSWDPHEEDEYLVTDERLYPARLAGRRPLPHADELPKPIARVYGEVLTALGSQMPVLAGIGIRALVEGVCKERGAKGKDLQERINHLVDLRVLALADAEILHSLRELGNSAAHETKAYSSTQLGMALTVVEHLLDGVYIHPVLAKKILPPPKQKVTTAPALPAPVPTTDTDTDTDVDLD